MKRLPEHLEGIDWSLTTWEGSRREQLRRWATTPLAEIIARLEEMEQLSVALQEAAEREEER